MEERLDTIESSLLKLIGQALVHERRIADLEEKLAALSSTPPIGCDADAHIHSLDKLRTGEGC